MKDELGIMPEKGLSIGEKVSEILRVLFLFTIFINSLFSAAFRVCGLGTDFLPTVFYVFYFVCFVVYIFLKPHNKLGPTLITLLLLALTFTSFLTMDGLFEKHSNDFLIFLLIALPCLIMFSDRIIDYTYTALGILCYVSGTFFSLVFFIQLFSSNLLNNFDYQSVSYSLIIPVLFLFQKKKGFYGYVLLATMLFFTVFMGGRGPLICISAYFVYHYLTSDRTKVTTKVLIVALATIVLLFYEPIVLLIADGSQKLGLRGSFSTYLKYGNVFSDSGRGEIYSFSFSVINEKWYSGHGFFADRVLLSSIDKSYPHNLFLEVLLQFGYPVAIAFFAAFMYKSLMLLFSLKNGPQEKQLFDLLFFSTGFAVLLFSSSYLLQPAFFALISVLFRKKRSVYVYKKSLVKL